MEVSLVFPHQLYQQHDALAKGRLVILIEDELYFSQYSFHKQKLVLHRATMKWYEKYLQKKGFTTRYISQDEAALQTLLKKLKSEGVTTVHYTDPVDYLLTRRLKRFAGKSSLESKVYNSPNFINSSLQNEEQMKGEKKFLMANFYIKQRKRLAILMDETGPVGGKWSFDAENRQKVPKGMKLPEVTFPAENEFVTEAKQYVTKNFKSNPGAIEKFPYAVTFQDAEKMLDDFLIHRMKDFGAYEDAILQKESILFHSLLTPALNIGLFTPERILERTLELHDRHNFPLNSLEGFIRQIIGWREFMRLMYDQKGVFLRTNNHFKYTRKIPASFYDGTTGIAPIDTTIKKILATGYCHHIERLMVLSNFMLLCEFDPEEVYRWFMELFVDAYDWVMVPNVYGMGQYADGGLMTTKPYVSGSSYILKMSDYPKGEWCEVWDALYWRFIYTHRKSFAKNIRMSMMVSLVNKMDQKKLEKHIRTANTFLKGLSR